MLSKIRQSPEDKYYILLFMIYLWKSKPETGSWMWFPGDGEKGEQRVSV